MLCKLCGRVVPEGKRLCPYCRTPVNAVSISMPETKARTDAPYNSPRENDTPRVKEAPRAYGSSSSPSVSSSASRSVQSRPRVTETEAPRGRIAEESTPEQKPKSKKPIAILLVLLLFTIVLSLLVISRIPKTVYLDDYFDVVIDGYESYGTATVVWDEKALYEIDQALLNKISHVVGDLPSSSAATDRPADSTAGIPLSLRHCFEILLNGEPSLTKLSEGDVVSLSLQPLFADLGERLGVSFALRKATYTVDSLGAVHPLSLAEAVKPAFLGYNGTGLLSFDTVSTVLTFGERGHRAVLSGNDTRVEVNFEDREGTVYATLYYEVDLSLSRFDKLSNGDTVTLMTHSPLEELGERLKALGGIYLTEERLAFSVEKLPLPYRFDRDRHYRAQFVGYDTVGVARYGILTPLVDAGDYTLRLYTEEGSSRRLYIDVLDKNNTALKTVYYYADSYKDLSNGDTVTYRFSDSVETIRERYGVIFEESYTETVSGLVSPLTLDPFDYAQLSFAGKEGEGYLTLTRIEDSAVLGDYRVSLTPSFAAGSVGKLTLSLADKDGTTLFTATYLADRTTGLRNGDKVTFTCLTSESLAAQYLTDHGVLLIGERSFTVSNLRMAEG